MVTRAVGNVVDSKVLRVSSWSHSPRKRNVMCKRCGFVQLTPGAAGRASPANSSTTDSGGHTATNKRGTA